MTREEIKQWHKKHAYGARDEAYIDAVLSHVKAMWLKRSYERLGQALINHSGALDLFNIRDEVWAPK